MAKAKHQELSIEEKLEQTLVPEDKQPYEVPSNWVWIQLNKLTTIISKGTTPKGGKDAYIDEGVAFLRVENINSDGIIDLSNIKYIDKDTHEGLLKRSILAEGDILISIAGTLGRTAIVKNEHLPLNTNQALAFVRLNEKVKDSNRYIEKALSSPTIQSFLLDQTKVTSIPNLTLEIISNCLIPFPPSTEQQRIVDRIESLFEKLDNAKELAQNAHDTFETRKAAILHKAFTGELTAKWREKNGVGMDSWAKKSLISVFKFIDYRGKTPTKTEFGIPLVTAKNVKKGYIDYTIKEFISPDEFADRKSRGIAQNGDILFTTEAPLGNVALADLDTYSTAQRLIVLQQNGTIKINNKCVMYYMLTGDFQNKLDEQKTGSTVAGIKAAKLKNVEVLLPAFAEQQEIVRILDELFEQEEKAEELCDVIEKIDLMKKAILARAFRGELGTNDPNEESAVELLKEC